MNWSSLHAAAWWPLVLAFAGALLVGTIWVRKKGALFPDIGLVRELSSAGKLIDRAPLLLGMSISLLFMVSLMNISVSRVIDAEKRARDFLVVVDTSRSMRENTALLRESYPPTYERRADLYIGQSESPADIPQLARYEIARESLLKFLSARHENDRVGLVYFNSMVYLMSGFTSNFKFINQQLAAMDPYVTYGTNIRWALEKGLDTIERYPGRNRRAVILLTDAEARNTDYLQEQLDRMRKLGVAFYLLWITTDASNSQSPLATEFLRTARSLGSVYTIDDVSEGYLDDALDEIADLEDYAYREVRHERVNLSRYSLVIAKWLMLCWILLLGTVYMPLTRISFAGHGHA